MDEETELGLSLEITDGAAGACRVAAAGELDIATADQLVEAVETRCHGRLVVELDLAGVTFLDSSGIHALMRLSSSSIGFAVCRDFQPQVQRVLEVSGTLELIPLVD